MRIAVTGAHGKLGRSVVRALVEAGHQVTALDRVSPPEGAAASGIVLDLTDAGQVLDAMAGIDEHHDGIDAIVHLAAIPAPGRLSDVATFENNMLTTYNVLNAARKPASSASSRRRARPCSGCRSTPRRRTSRLTRSIRHGPRPLTRWSSTSRSSWRSSWCAGTRAEHHRHAVLERHGPGRLRRVPVVDADPLLRRWNLWGYIDARDGAQAMVRALEVTRPGFEAYIIADADTVMSRPSAELVAAVFPDVPRDARARRARHDAVDRQGAAAARVRAPAQLAGRLS